MKATRVAAAAAAAVVAGLVVAPTGGATPAFRFDRIQGVDRFETAGNIARATFATADLVVLTTGEGWPYGLASGYFAGLAGAPLPATEPGSSATGRSS